MIGRAITRSGRPGLLGTAAHTAVVAGTATAVSGRVVQRQSAGQREGGEAALDEQAQAAASQAPPAPPLAAQSDDLISQLRELGQLRQQGVLTEEEFATQKARLLNG